MEKLPLQSERLILRPMARDDAADLATRRSDPETARFQSWTVPYTIERARALIDEVSLHDEPTPGSWFQFAVERREDGRVVGDLAVRLADDGRTAEIGFTLHPWARGLGYATEAATRLIDYLVDSRDIHRVEASADPTNAASIRVLSRLGFTAEGVKRESYWRGDEVSGRRTLRAARARVAGGAVGVRPLATTFGASHDLHGSAPRRSMHAG